MPLFRHLLKKALKQLIIFHVLYIHGTPEANCFVYDDDNTFFVCGKSSNWLHRNHDYSLRCQPLITCMYKPKKGWHSLCKMVNVCSPINILFFFQNSLPIRFLSKIVHTKGSFYIKFISIEGKIYICTLNICFMFLYQLKVCMHFMKPHFWEMVSLLRV